MQGGLGNQLFQLAFADNLSRKVGGKIFIDTSAFKLDKNFKRKFKLKCLNLEKADLKDKVFLYINRFFYKILKKKIIKFSNIVFINDSKNSQYEKTFFKFNYNNTKTIYIVGFFQSENYILNSEILKKFYKKIIISKKTENILNKIKNNDVLIGMRFFEENKKLQKNFGGIEDYSFYNKFIKLFIKKNKKKFYLMTSKKIKIEKLIKGNYIFIDQKNINDFEKLVILSKFKNFIISNSTFYFWGYFFAKINSINKNKIKILYSKKFINKNTII